MTETMATAPIRKSVHVRCDVAQAFRVFTTEIGSWWPTETHALAAGRVREVVWEEHEGGEVYEISTTGERERWATVLLWDPPHRLVIAWQVNPERLGTEIEARFTPDGDGTLLALEHRHWGRLGDAAAEMRAGYDTGWDAVLAPYVERLS
jgi:uncharacterized protein YndB with AHSA1/START domain